MNTIKVSLVDLTPDPDNARTHDAKNLAAIVGSLKEFGQQKPIVIDKKNRIVAGNGTVLAAAELGWTEVSAVRTKLTGHKAKAYALADNRTAELADWDKDILKVQLDELVKVDIDIAAFGFDLDEVGTEGTEGLTDPDAVPEVPQNVFGVKRGDIWQLGDHRVMCGDSTDKGDVDRLMGGATADMVFTSPPYNAAKDSFLNDSPVNGFDKKYSEHTDDFSDADYLEFLTKFTNISLAVAGYVFVNIQLLSNNRIPVIDYQCQFKEQIKDILVWNKKICPPNIVKGAFNTKWEYLICFSNDRKTRGFPCKWQGQHPNVIETESNSSNKFAEDHKAGFPVAFPLWVIEKMDFAKSVYDPFLGTGTTLIACEKTNRKCYGMEIDPHYCSVIIKRWQDYTGKEATLAKG